jgi:glutamine synthetase
MVESNGSGGDTAVTVKSRDETPVFAVPEDLPLDSQRIQQCKQHLIDQGVECCYASYVDIHGAPKAKTVPVEHFEKMCGGSELFTVGAMEGMGLRGPEDDECAAVPELDTCRILPWDRTQAMFFGELYYHGEPFAYDSRVILKRVMRQAAEMGLSMNLGCEPEFYVVHWDDTSQTPRPMPRDGYRGLCPAYDISQTHDAMGFLRPMLQYMRETDFGLYSFDQEGGHGQYEFDFAYDDVLTMCDRFVFLRLMAKKVAEQIGAVASFMPKPFADDFRSGAHFNMSLVDIETGKNVFAPAEDGSSTFSADGKTMLSDYAKHFTAGLLHHAKALTAVTCPTYNSYQGLIAQGNMPDMSWAPVMIGYGQNNRSSMLRLPPNRYCVENRAPDMACNPYLSAAFSLAAGLDGIRRELEPGEALNENCYSLSKKQLKERGIELLPRTLLHALEALEDDPLADEVFGSFKDIYIEQKTGEWDQAFYEVHPKMLKDRFTFL